MACSLASYSWYSPRQPAQNRINTRLTIRHSTMTVPRAARPRVALRLSNCIESVSMGLLSGSSSMNRRAAIAVLIQKLAQVVGLAPVHLGPEAVGHVTD